jgi:hypothetical protein
MYIYNITTKVDNNIADEWKHWQKQTHIPETMITGFFYDCRFYELLEQNDEEGMTFVIQYFALELEDYKEYIRNHAPLLIAKAFDKWKNQFIAFRTLLKSVN